MIGLLARAGLAADMEVAGDDGPLSEGADRVVQLNEEGSALYAAGDYRRAAERFLQAYAVDEDPNLLFNIASCYEALGDIDAALEKYRAFLAAPHADPEGRPRAEQAIVRLSALEPPPPEPSKPAAGPAPSASALPDGPADVVAQDSDWVPWVGLGGGAVLGALGATFYLMGAADHAELTDTAGFGEPGSVASITRGRADGLVRSGDTKKAVGVASASAGAALIVGSIVWWLFYPEHTGPAPAATSAGLEVTSSPSGTGLRVSGAF